MSSRIFDRDTLLDLTVNVIPLAIMAFFIVVFVVYNPSVYAWDNVFSTIQLAIVGTTFILLAVLTYYAGKAIAGAEKEIGMHAQTTTYNPDAAEQSHEEAESEELTEEEQDEPAELEAGEDDA